MKTIRFTVFLMLFGLYVMVFSCKKENNPAAAPQTGGKIAVSGQDAGTGLKTTLSGLTTIWIATSDRVGIYSPEARTLTDSGGSAIVNSPFSAESSTASSTFSGTMYWGAATIPHTFYAYYPYTAGSAASTAVPVSLATAQTQSAANSSAHIGALDFLVATPVTVASPANTNSVANEVSLRYNHLFSILEFQVKGSGTLKAVKLVGTSNPVAFSGGTINITQAVPATEVAYTFASRTGTTTEAAVTLTSPATLTVTNTDTKVYMVINPGTQTGNCLIGLSSDGTTWNYISKAAPAGGFLRGKKYVVTIDQADAGLTTVTDSDGNTFGIVTIGMQTWMAENLKTTTLNDGTAIALVTDPTAWGSLSTPGYTWYNNNSTTYKNVYGGLYNWYAVNSGKLCPTGWHVPTDAEWSTLTTFLGGATVAGAELKEAGTSHWVPTNTGATNTSGFTALPGGIRTNNGSFYSIGSSGFWWSASAYNSSNAFYKAMDYNLSDVTSASYEKTAGSSVRCLRD